MKSDTSRRKFLKLAGAAGATLSAGTWSALARGESANERIRIGVMGTGVRGKFLIGNLPESARVTAICDCANSRMVDTLKPRGEFKAILANFRDNDAARCALHQDYRRLIDREELDAVIIATPDHHHVPAAMLALQAGLDVYLEKPMTVTIGEGRLLADMVKKTGRVLQVGSQQRTMEINRFACEFIRDGGLGKVTRVDCPNYPGPLRDSKFPAEKIPPGLDWKLFLGSTPDRPHNRKLWVKDEFKVGDLLWRGWDLFRDYSGHLTTNWGAHSLDMVQYALGKDDTGPTKVGLNRDVATAAIEQDWRGKWHAKTPRPESWEASRLQAVTLEYADGTTLNLLPGVDAAVFHGERGRMVIGRNKFRADPPEIVKEGPDPQIAKKWQGSGHVARPHIENWLHCIRTRGVPNAPVEVGHRSVTVCHLANIAREVGRPLRWNPDDETFSDETADTLLARPS